MDKNARFAILWFFVFYVLNTFIGPLVGINDVPITVEYALVNLLIWGGAALIVYFIKKRQQKKITKNEKVG